jgi:hypothetical protein
MTAVNDIAYSRVCVSSGSADDGRIRLRRDLGRPGSPDGLAAGEDVAPARIALEGRVCGDPRRLRRSWSGPRRQLCPGADLVDEHTELIIASLSMPDGDPLQKLRNGERAKPSNPGSS